MRDLALGLTRHDAVAFGRQGGPTALGRARIEALHPSERGGFSPGLRENLRVLTRLVTTRGADAWHFFFAPNPKTSRAARLVSSLRRARTVQTVCSVPGDGVDLERVLFADRVVVLSRHTEQRFLRAGIARERLVRIAPAAPPLDLPDPAQRATLRGELGLHPERPLVLYPGDLEFGRAARLMVDAHARLAGDTELALACRAKTPAARQRETELKERARELGTLERVRFVGETPRIVELLGVADVVALPSEVAYAKMDYPLVLLEAMALGCPVIVAEATPAAELADDGGALAVEPNETALAALLGRLLLDSRARVAQGTAARAAILANFGRARMAAAYELLYDALLS